MASQEGGNIRVAVRVRPFNSRELERQAKCIVRMENSQTILAVPEDSSRSNQAVKSERQKIFNFDKSYWSFNPSDEHFAGQEALFRDLGSPLLDNAFVGYNACIFAYGQTGSGKSYSMMGSGEANELGLIPRICRDLFARISRQQDDANVKFRVEVSYLEIYNERVRDLLNPRSKGNLKVREHPVMGPYVEDLAKLAVTSFPDINNLMNEGNQSRTVAATRMNETSSRSHAVFTLILTQKRHDEETSMDAGKVSRISLVDLAGSERAASTGATGARLKEGAQINKSLSTLGRVIAALADHSTGKARKVPYRDSVLTWLLKDSLGGNSMTAMVAALSPADMNFEETLSTLRYADSAKRIKNHAVVNEDPNAKMIRELKDELAQLRSKLRGSGVPGAFAEQSYPPDTPLEKQMVTIVQTDGTIKQVSKAEIADQLNASEKLYDDLRLTWEEKLQKTEQIHREREAALEDLGISIEHGTVGLSTPRKTPHLLNLNDDPLLAECLIYNLKHGITRVGNVDLNQMSEIRLNGTRILKDHCNFENNDGVVTLNPCGEAAILVNGQRIKGPTRLRSSCRIILGDFHIFRFNNPEEARAERAEKGVRTKLRQVQLAARTASPRLQVQDSIVGNDVPSEHVNGLRRAFHGHQTSIASISQSESRSETPIPALDEEKYDWSYARMEAAAALKETGDEDEDSDESYLQREKYMSAGTIDNFSLDTALTLPSSPYQAHNHDTGTGVRNSQSPLDSQHDEYFHRHQNTESTIVQMGPVGSESLTRERSYNALKAEMEERLSEQKRQFEESRARDTTILAQQRIGELRTPSKDASYLMKTAFHAWHSHRYVRMAEVLLRCSILLKEVQVLSDAMDLHLRYQFAIVEDGIPLVSSYDLVMVGESIDEHDGDLSESKKPCIGVRVIDTRANVISLVSIKNVRRRLRWLRQRYQYIDRPAYLQHLSMEDPFSDNVERRFSVAGLGEISLSSVYQARVRDYDIDITSPFTHNIIGVVKLSLEPSLSQGTASLTKFSVVLHEIRGFPEREGSQVHVQLSTSGSVGVPELTTTQLVSGFDEDPIRFGSVHNMGLTAAVAKDAMLRIVVFARVTPEHIEKLHSWDSIRDPKLATNGSRHRFKEAEFDTDKQHNAFVSIEVSELTEMGQYEPVEVVQENASAPRIIQLHQGLQRRIALQVSHTSGDSLRWNALTEVSIGKVQLVDSEGRADASTPADSIQLRAVAAPSLDKNSNGILSFNAVYQWDSSLHGSVLLDRVTQPNHQVYVTLTWKIHCRELASPMKFRISLPCQVQSRSYIRPSTKFYQLWNQTKISHSFTGNFDVLVQTSGSKRAVDLWRMDTRHEYVKGEEQLKHWMPRGLSLIRDFVASRARSKRALELEEAETRIGYQESLPPRPLTASSLMSFFAGTNDGRDDYSGEETNLLRRCLDLWQTKHPWDHQTVFLPETLSEVRQGQRSLQLSVDSSSRSTSTLSNRSKISTESVRKGQSPPPPRFSATVTYVPPNAQVVRSGILLTPNTMHSRWARTYVELRPPYLHIYALNSPTPTSNGTHQRPSDAAAITPSKSSLYNPKALHANGNFSSSSRQGIANFYASSPRLRAGDEVMIINLRNARVDREPKIGKLLICPKGWRVWAIWAEGGSWIWCCRETEVGGWVLAMDGV